MIDLRVLARDHTLPKPEVAPDDLRASSFLGLLLAAAAIPVRAQEELKPWKHGVIEPKGDAGFMLMLGQRDFASKRGLKIEIVPLKNGATAHKALLSGELDSINQVPAPPSWPAHAALTSRSSDAIGRASLTG